MPEQTGNVWNDPDTIFDENGKKRTPEERVMANPGNVILSELKSAKMTRRKYGPAVLDSDAHAKMREERRQLSMAAASANVTSEVENLNARAAELAAQPPLDTELRDDPPTPEVETGDDDFDALKAEIKKIGVLARAGDAESTARLHEISIEEWKRGTERRVPIIHRLAAYGVGKPPDSVL